MEVTVSSRCMEQLVVCGKCGRRFGTTAAYRRHCTDSHRIETPRLKCIYGCERWFRNEGDMNKHRAIKHSNGVDAFLRAPSELIPALHRRLPFVCAECGVDYGTLDQLHDHQTASACKQRDGSHVWLSDVPGSLKCEACVKVCDNHSSLEQHFVSNHAVIKLRPDDKRKIEQERMFLAQWKKEKAGDISFQAVFKVYNSAWRAARYEKYRCEIEANSRRSHRSQGNEMLLYHGTSLTCDLGSERQGAKLCSYRKERRCNMCSIVRQGFLRSKAAPNRWQRFGSGIYVTPHSGKSDDYIPYHATRRAVFVCKVLTGRQFETKVNMPDLTLPPPGYDSVWGKPGQHLNYDEFVVYNSRAILPAYIIVYTKPSSPCPQPNTDSRFLGRSNSWVMLDGSSSPVRGTNVNFRFLRRSSSWIMVDGSPYPVRRTIGRQQLVPAAAKDSLDLAPSVLQCSVASEEVCLEEKNIGPTNDGHHSTAAMDPFVIHRPNQEN